MKQPFWKRALSYLGDIPIDSTSSRFSPDLQIYLSRGQYQLVAKNAIYSFGTRYDNFVKVFERIPFKETPIKDVLILGFGLGSIPYMLEKKFKQDFHYTAIEIDEEILYLANQYVLDDLKSPIECICTDAFAYTMQCQEKYDLICIDVFIDDVVPIQFEDKDFLFQIKDMLTPNGRVIYNRLAVKKKDKKIEGNFFEDIFNRVFPDSSYLVVEGNWMLCNFDVEKHSSTKK